VPTLASRYGPLWPHKRTRPDAKGRVGPDPAPTSAPPIDLCWPRRCRSSRPTGTADLTPRPYQHLEVAAMSGIVAGGPVPGAATFPRPSQHLKVAAGSDRCAGSFVPWARWVSRWLSRPPQHLDAPSYSGFGSGRLIPRAAIFPRPAETRDGADEVAHA